MQQSDDESKATIDGARCEFGPGLAMQSIVFCEVGGGNSRIATSGLVSSISNAQLVATLSEFGPARVTRKHETYAFAAFDHADHAAAAVKDLNASPHNRWARQPPGRDPRPKRCVTVTLAATPGSIVTHNTSVKVMWYAPSSIAWAHFTQRGSAQEAARRGHGKVLRGRVVSMRFQQPSHNQRTSFSVWMGGIGEGASDSDIKAFLRLHGGLAPTSVSLEPPPFSEKRAGKLIEGLLQSVGPLSTFDEAPRPAGVRELKCQALARFARPGSAEEACGRFNNQPAPLLGGCKLLMQRVFSAKFVLLSPIYGALQAQLGPVLEPIRHKVFSGATSTTITLQADSPTAIALAKGLLAPIVSGERVTREGGDGVLWDARFARPEMEAELQKLNAALGGSALVRCDPQRRELRIWGESEPRERAQAALRKLYADLLQSHPNSVPLGREQFVAVVRLGLVDELKAACGARSVSLDLQARALLVEGAPEVLKRALAFLATRLRENTAPAVVQSSDGEETLCAVCWSPPEAPVKLACSHEYCGSCLGDWLRATCSAGGGPSFPIECLADGCKRPVAIADLSAALSQGAMHNLRRAALGDYVNANLDWLQFCISPGCGGIFPLNEARVARCSDCGICICTSCRVEEHEGLTCNQFLQAKAPPDRLRLRVIEEILTLQCPRCAQAFFDFEGYFALRCSKCPCGFCGWCLADCGTDAHKHVITCAAKPPRADVYFGTRTEFEVAQRKRQSQRLQVLLDTLPLDERDRLVQALATDLKDLHLEL